MQTPMRRSGTSRDACNLMFWSPKVEGDRVLLHEIYSDKAAFDAHLQTEHFRVFNSASESWCLQNPSEGTVSSFRGRMLLPKERPISR